MSTKDEEKEVKEEGGGIFSKLKGMIFEEEADSGGGDKPAPASKPTSGASLVPAPAPPATIAYGASAPDPRIRSILEKDVQAAAAPALTALDAMCANLAEAIPDEGTRIKAGLAAIKSQHTFDAVITDVDECLQALDQKSRENQAAVQAAIQQRVGAREAAIADIDRAIALKSAAVERFKNEIAEHESRKASETAAIATERAEIDRTNANFAATVDAYRAELVVKKQKITAYGKGA